MSFDISPRMYFGMDEPYVAQLAQEYLHPGDVVYDIGAHIGYTTLLFADGVGPSGIVHSFEILPSVANGFLRRTLSANKLTNVVVHSVGLCNCEQSIRLPVGETMMTSFYSQDSARGGGKIEECRTYRLEEYQNREHLPVPTLIKIDIEGAEIDCLLGAMAIIKAAQPKLIIEFHSLQLLIEGMKILSPLGYSLRTREKVIDEESVQEIKWFHANVFCSTNPGIGAA